MMDVGVLKATLTHTHVGKSDSLHFLWGKQKKEYEKKKKKQTSAKLLPMLGNHLEVAVIVCNVIICHSLSTESVKHVTTSY